MISKTYYKCPGSIITLTRTCSMFKQTLLYYVSTNAASALAGSLRNHSVIGMAVGGVKSNCHNNTKLSSTCTANRNLHEKLSVLSEVGAHLDLSVTIQQQNETGNQSYF